jgi:hypothetical protein
VVPWLADAAVLVSAVRQWRTEGITDDHAGERLYAARPYDLVLLRKLIEQGRNRSARLIATRLHNADRKGQ